jgi:hypothetical protein
MSPLRLDYFIASWRSKALKKVLSLILALIFSCGVVGSSLAQQAAPTEEPAAAAEQAGTKKAKKSKKTKKAKKGKKAKKAGATPATPATPQ